MRTGQITDFAPDRTDFGSLTSVETLAFIQDGTTHGFFFNIVVVAVDKRSFFFQFFFAELCLEFFADGIESIHTLMLILVTGSCNCISLVIAGVVNSLAEFFIVYFVAVFAFYGRTDFFCQFHLGLTLYLDCFVSSFHGFQQVSFGNFIHFTFHHHDVFISGAYHQIHVSLFQLLKSRIDNKFAVDTCYAYFGNRSVERNI